MGKHRILTLTSFSLLLSFCFCGLAFANGNAGEAQPSGGGCYSPSMGYSSYNDTCYGGISWRFYTLNGGNYNTSTDSYTISTENSGSATIRGCNGTDGYWLLAYESYNTKSSYPYVSSYIGSQRGAVKLNMSAHWSSGYARDATLSGSGFPSFPGKVYTSVSDFKANGIKNGSVGSWDMVASLFAEMPSEYKNGHSWSSSDDLAWFCYSPDITTQGEYFTSSHTSNRDSADATSGGGFVGTEIVNTKKTATPIPERQVNVGDTVPITFSHDVYSSTSKSGVSWRIQRTMNGGNFLNSTSYTISTPSGGKLSANSTASNVSGTTNITVDRGSSISPRYEAPKNYTDGDKPHFYRNYYKITFKQEGTYKFCETIYLDGTEYTTACSVIQVGDPPKEKGWCTDHTPSSYSNSNISSGTTSTLSAVKNTSNPKYTSWNELVYAKPTDNVQFIHCYYPGAQRVKKSSSHGAHNSNGASSSNGARDKFVATSNNFSVEQFNFYSNKSESYSIGDDTIREWQSNNHTVETSKAGDTIDQTSKGQNGSASSWFVDNSWTYYVYEQNGAYCGYEVGPNDANGNPTQGPAKSCNVPHTAYHSSPTDYYDGSASGTASDTATVIVPYNFTNTAEASFTTNSNNGVVFAGETTSAQISINVNTRWNNTTSVDREYATRVDSAKYSIIAYTTNSPNKAGSSSYGSGKNADLCGYFTNKTHGNCNVLKSEDNQTLNSGESMSGSTNENKLYNDGYRIYDAPAGEYYCIAAAVYPANSGSDTNTSASGNNSWYISNSTCKAIAKRPVFQIWGGGFYSAGNVSASTTSKGHIVGYYNYSATGGSNALFSSWGELAVVSNGVVSNLASGAATSYTYANKNAYNYVSNFARDNCQRARLSFANSICSGGTTGSSGIAADYSIKNTIISRYATEDKYVSNTVTIAGKTIPQKTVEVTYASGVNITGDILYEETAYVSASQVPQYIIYSTGDINISCNVNRIDAWLIANGTINTCSNATNATVTNGLIDDASGVRSRQLKINGVIIADRLILGRTYGAATGSNSGTPAEIINLSGASYIWAENTASDTPKLYTTYLRELAPRY